MSNIDTTDDQPLSPAQARIVSRVRWLMLISGLATVLGIAVVITVIGYRLFHADGSTAPPDTADTIVRLPAGARIVSTAVAADQIVITIDIGGAMEIRTFDAKTLKATGRLRIAVEP
jgi:hypothetical protein